MPHAQGPTDENLACFLAACSEGDVARVREMADAGMVIDASDASGKTGLMLAASRNRAAVMAFLLERGADPKRQNANGTTPLMFAKTAAFAYGDCTGMKLLLDWGADRDARDRNGLTAREYTSSRAEMIIKFLEEYKK